MKEYQDILQYIGQNCDDWTFVLRLFANVDCLDSGPKILQRKKVKVQVQRLPKIDILSRVLSLSKHDS
jgi:hypothetical protein